MYMGDELYTVPSEDKHWCIQERDHHEDLDDLMDSELAGGYAVAYRGRRDPQAVYIQYEERRDGGYFGLIHFSIVEGNDPTEVWLMAYGLYEEGDPDELTESYNETVAPLSDSEFLEALAEYEAGALDFVGDLESGIVDVPFGLQESQLFMNIWSGVLHAETDKDVRRLLEGIAREKLGMLGEVTRVNTIIE